MLKIACKGKEKQYSLQYLIMMKLLLAIARFMENG